MRKLNVLAAGCVLGLSLAFGACASWAAPATSGVNVCLRPVHHIDMQDGGPTFQLEQNAGDGDHIVWNNITSLTHDKVSVACYYSQDESDSATFPVTPTYNNCRQDRQADNSFIVTCTP